MTDTKQSTDENDVIKQFMELLNQQNMGSSHRTSWSFSGLRRVCSYSLL